MCYNENFNTKQIFSEQIENVLKTDYFLQLEDMKEESPVIANQKSCGELVLELCTNRPSRSEKWFAESEKSDLDCVFAEELTVRVGNSLIGTKS
jgi:hypothetical protein